MGAGTHRSLEYHLLHPLILSLLVLCAAADFEAHSSLLQNRLHPQILIPNACPDKGRKGSKMANFEVIYFVDGPNCGGVHKQAKITFEFWFLILPEPN